MKRAGGTFRGNRSSSPYAAPCAQERANDGVATSTTQRVVAARADMDDRADGRPVATASTIVVSASGAPVRAAVRPTGRGASSATNTTNHVDHNSTAAVVLVDVDHGAQRVGRGGTRGDGKRDPRDAEQQDVHIIGARSLRSSSDARSYTTNLMLTSPHAGALAPGSRLALAACRITTRSMRPRSRSRAPRVCRRCRSSRSSVRARGSSRSGPTRCRRSRSRVTARSTIDRARVTEPVAPAFSAASHAGLFAFLAEADASLPPRIKVQIVGPLTSGVALEEAGLPDRAGLPARRRSGAHVGARAGRAHVAVRAPHTPVLLFLDEPALVLWRRDIAPLEREHAVDLLSSSLAATLVPDRRPRLRRRRPPPRVRGGARACSAFRSRTRSSRTPTCSPATSTPTAGSRGARSRPTVRSATPPTRSGAGSSRCGASSPAAAATRCGCAPAGSSRPRAASPGHGLTQADRALRLAAEIAGRVGDQSVAARLTVGA